MPPPLILFTLTPITPTPELPKNAGWQLMNGAAVSEHSHGRSAWSPARSGTGTHVLCSSFAAE